MLDEAEHPLTLPLEQVCQSVTRSNYNHEVGTIDVMRTFLIQFDLDFYFSLSWITWSRMSRSWT